MSPAVGHGASDPNISFSNDQAGSEGNWVITKRYTNFVSVHEQLKPYFLALGIEAPPLPPRIENK